MSSLKKFILLICLLFAVSASAESAPAEGEETAKESAEGGEKAEDAAPAATKTTLPGWVPVETKIQELHAKIKSKEGNILKLIEQKKNLPNNSPLVKSTVKEIVKEHKDLQQLIQDYQRNLGVLKYRFPERNAKAVRKYDRIEVKSLDEMESAVGIDGKLSRNMKKMRSQFQSPQEQAQAQAEAESTASVIPEKKSKKQLSIEEADSVILQK